jgi:membrane protein YqaA with SNARE-associated domain
VSDTAGERRGFLRRMYDWVLGWADRPGGAWALFGIAFAESSFFPIPPDALLIPLVLGRPTRGLWFAMVCTAGSVLGAIAGYLIGSFLFASIGQAILDFYGATDHYASLGQMFNENLWLTLGTAGFTPIPFKVFTIASGVFEVPLATLVVASAIGRSGRFFLVGTAIYVFGPTIRSFLDRYLEWITIALFVLLIAGFYAVRYLF